MWIRDVVVGAVAFAVGTIDACVDTCWRPVGGIHEQRAATCGIVTGGATTFGVAEGVGTCVGWRPVVALGGGANYS
jgi:hypothetical protein